MKPGELVAEFDGRPLRAPAGVSVAAALLAQGHQSWRTTRGTGAPRGLFCGIGVCWDCLVSIDEQPPVRACLVQLRAGMRISSADPRDAERPGPGPGAVR